MKNFVLILLCFGLFGAGFCDSACTDDDITTIASCYEKSYGNMTGFSWPFDLIDPLNPSIRTKEKWQPVCDTKQTLNDCIGSDRIQSCFNSDDIQKLPFVKVYPSKSMDKLIIASFIETDYTCDKLFKFSDEDFSCYNNSFAPIIEACPEDNSTTCESLNESTNCTIEETYKKCGKTVGCFQRKKGFLSACWSDFLFHCGSCDGISVANNQIDGLCDDDNVGEKDLDAESSFNNLN